MQIQIIYNKTEPGYRKTRRSTMPATLYTSTSRISKITKTTRTILKLNTFNCIKKIH